jgi:colicin import membrane protein
MHAAALPHDVLLPRPPGGTAPGAVLALLAHAGLLAALTLGVEWRTQAPEVVSAELWASVPQVAAPRVEAPAPAPAPVPAPAPPPPVEAAKPPPPAPAPPPQIAIEQAAKERRARELKLEREQAEREKEIAAKKKRTEDDQRKAALERERQVKLKADKAEAEDKKRRAAEAAERAAEDAKLAQQREENLRRMLGQAGAATGSATARGTAAQDAAPSAAYGSKLVARIKPNIVFTDSLAGNPAAEVEVRAAPNGTVIARRLLKSSGNAEWDEAVLRAIDRTGSLPRDSDGRVPPLISITFRPND